MESELEDVMGKTYLSWALVVGQFCRTIIIAVNLLFDCKFNDELPKLGRFIVLQ